MTVDDVRVSAARLPDGELRTLLVTYGGMAEDEALSGTLRGWYADLACAVAAVLSVRVLQWSRLSADPAVPPSWDVAVKALRPLPPDSP